ncbi:hypothetical protein V6B08_09115 [Ferrovibrio sp. MS7]|jgi:hypothetical protein|uniref:hypothetical protein n=1 Tax=Ferrovibrio plantarum TaxID=3119164 RepID=UPI00313635B8
MQRQSPEAAAMIILRSLLPRFLTLAFGCLLLVACAGQNAASLPPRVGSIMEVPLPPGTEAISLYAEKSGDVWWLEADGRRLHRLDAGRKVHEAIAADPPSPAGILNMDRQGRLWLLGRDGAPLLAIRVGDGEMPSREMPWRLDQGLPRETGQPALDLGRGGFVAVSGQGQWLWLAQPGKLLRITLNPA